MTKDGKTVGGVMRNEDACSLQFMGLDQQLHLYDRSKLQDRLSAGQPHAHRL